jgi:D-alanyl-D-alanine carboxypeptidase
VLLVHGDEVVLHEARGLSSVEYGPANRTDTRFNLGSINKLITRVAIGQLVEQGRLSLEDKIEKFLPGYPNRLAAGKVTVRQLTGPENQYSAAAIALGVPVSIGRGG